MLVVELSSVFDGVLLGIKMYILQIFLLGISKKMISDKVFCFVSGALQYNQHVPFSLQYIQ